MSWLEEVPKVELHLHLEGAIPHDALYQLIRKYQPDTAFKSVDALKELFVYSDFLHFLSVWEWKNNYLREYEDFTFIAQEVAKDLFSQNILYAEVFFSPSDFSRHGMKVDRIAEAIRAGLDKVPSVQVALITDLCRNNGPEGTLRILEEISDCKESGIIGIGLGGDEEHFPAKLFSTVYEQARENGFHTTVHAGEAAGPESVWDAIKILCAERIGHGTYAKSDPTLIAYLEENKIPIEMCPISNVQTRVISSLYEHPIKDFYERGIPVTVNTDDPKMFGNSLADEYTKLQEVFHFSKDDIRDLILNAVNVSWLSREERDILRSKITYNPQWSCED